MINYTDKLEAVSEMMDASINLLDYVLDDIDTGVESIVARLGRIITTLRVLDKQLSQMKAEQDNLVGEMIGADKEVKMNE